MGEEGIVLKNHADSAFMGWYCVDGLITQINLTMGGRFKPRQHHQAGCFARARGPEHSYEFPLFDVQIQVFNDKGFAVITFLHFYEADKEILITHLLDFPFLTIVTTDYVGLVLCF
jgi:hypothetical protein